MRKRYLTLTLLSALPFYLVFIASCKKDSAPKGTNYVYIYSNNNGSFFTQSSPCNCYANYPNQIAVIVDDTSKWKYINYDVSYSTNNGYNTGNQSNLNCNNVDTTDLLMYDLATGTHKMRALYGYLNTSTDTFYYVSQQTLTFEVDGKNCTFIQLPPYTY